MVRTIEKNLYQFNELSETAKEKARNWYRSCIDNSDFDCTIEDIVTVGNILGIDFHKKHNQTCIWWNTNPYDASYDASYRYKKGFVKELKAYAPQDKKLHAIAEKLAKAQKKAFYNLQAECHTSGRNNFMKVEVEHIENHDFDSKILEQVETALEDFAAWIQTGIYEQDKYLNSDEYLDESILANEYDFDESGERCDG